MKRISYLRASVVCLSLLSSHCAVSTTSSDGSVSRTDASGRTDASASETGMAGACMPATVDTIRAPQVVRGSGVIPWAATLPGEGCGCSVQTRSTETSAIIERCDCCDLCPCIDGPHVVNLTGLTSGDTTLLMANGQSTTVHSIAQGVMCLGGTTRFSTVEVQDNSGLQVTGDRRVWVKVTGTSMRCSSDPWPLVFVRNQVEPMFLELEDCNNSDCDGPLMPRPFTTWLSLGVLSPGRHSLFYSPGISVDFTVTP